MRLSALLRPVLAGLTCVCLVLAALFALTPNRSLAFGDRADAVGPSPDRPRPPRISADSLARVVSSKDPFRASRSPALARFDPRGPEGGGPPPAAPPRQAPVVAGILAGAEPAVLLEGIPGIEGTRVLRAGERAGAYLVRTITPEQVVVVGPDTTWTLRVRNRFQ